MIIIAALDALIELIHCRHVVPYIVVCDALGITQEKATLKTNLVARGTGGHLT